VACGRAPAETVGIPLDEEAAGPTAEADGLVATADGAEPTDVAAGGGTATGGAVAAAGGGFWRDIVNATPVAPAPATSMTATAMTRAW